MNPFVAAVQILAPFSFTFAFSQIPIRWLADGSPRLRLYYDKHGFHLAFGKKRRGHAGHLHHFLWGFPSIAVAVTLFIVGSQFPALLVTGFAGALWFSEAKEMISQKWGR